MANKDKSNYFTTGQYQDDPIDQYQNDWLNRHEQAFELSSDNAKELSTDYLVRLIDDHSKQLVEIASILKTLTKEIKDNRNLVTKASEVTAAIVNTLNIMNDGK